jgi:hypothetical protein
LTDVMYLAGTLLLFAALVAAVWAFGEVGKWT